MGLRKGQTPKNFTECQQKAWTANRGRPAWNKGKSPSPESRLKMSLARKGKYMGSNHPKWKGGRKKRDRRRVHICTICTVSFLGQRGSGTARACPSCTYITAPCRICSIPVTVKRSEFNEGRGKFCSRGCAAKGLKRYKGIDSPFWKHGRATIANRKTYQREHRLANSARYSHYSLTRQRRKAGAAGSHTLEQWQELKSHYNHMCLCCKQQEPFIKLTEDHIMPISRGGSDYISNIQPLCISCNSQKHTKAFAIIGEFTPISL